MSLPMLHMIGNAHIDPVWLWQWQEGFQEVKSTFRSALDRMNEDDEFLFASSSAAFYSWVEENDPGMFAEIQQRVAQGRWEIVGGWWIQPDCNIPSGESFVRQGLYGQRYFKQKFGVTATVGYNVDSFGHHGMLPQILKKSGMDSYVFMRPGPHEKGLPGHVFWWESDDGSKVLTARILFEYCTWGKDLDKHVVRCAQQLRDPVDQLMCFYGVGNHGGGPTKENLQSIHRLQQDASLPALIFSTPNRYFAAIKEQDTTLPVVHDDLQHHASGCYSAHSGIKRWNRKAENLLLAAEKWSGIARYVTGQPYPVDFERAWKDVLFNQFHDILAGTSLESAYEDARDFYGEAMTIASRGLNLAVQSLSWRIGIPQETGMKPIVVFNPHGFAVKAHVELEMGGLPEHAVLVDHDDHHISWQTIQSHATANGRNRIAFVADLPSLGYQVFRLKPGYETVKEADPNWIASDVSLENRWLRLVFNPETGYIESLFDKERGVEVFRSAGAVPVVMDDPSDTWSHDVLQFQHYVGQFQSSSVSLVEHGDVLSVIRVRSNYGQSVLVQDFIMYKELRHIDVRVTVDWREQFKMLKIKFPVNLNFTTGTYEIPYGHIVRQVNGEEEPGQGWIDLTGIANATGELYGLSILNDGKYSFDMRNKDISLTVLRSPIYAHHVPKVPTPEGHYSYIDQGIQRFTYSLLAHPGSWQTAETVQRAFVLNQPPIALVETYHEGNLPHMTSFASVSAGNIMISALKKAEDSEDLILRAYESSGIATTASIRLSQWSHELTATFKPCEIKTFLIPKDTAQSVREVNLLEWE